ncbi:MAG: carbohydrate-binding module family 42 protein [Polyangiaceae bacterium]|nr:carbohydrate-binding module family 42 protein [Polyangiaceae bacterium]
MISRRFVIPFGASVIPLAASVAAIACSDPGETGGTGGSGPGVAGSSMAGSPAGGSAPVGGVGNTAGGPTAGTAGANGGSSSGASGGGAGGSPAGGAGGSAAGGPAGGSAGAAGSGGSGGGGSMNAEGPCDVYKKAGNECVAAYSTIRRLSSAYKGPLYQVRSGSNAMNTGSGGMLHDIPMTADGFGDAAAQNAVCPATTTCTVAKLYDQSGRGNDLIVAKGGLTNGGQYAALDDFETIANKGPLMVAGKSVYSLFMEARQGYRISTVGAGMPRDAEPQGIYMLADGTRAGTACCWDFGNVTTNPKSYAEMNTLFFGSAFWGRGAGNGPWFGADFEAGVWMGGSRPGEPGWGGLNDARDAPPNMNNPSMRVKYALGFLKTSTTYALRMADLVAANTLTTAYEGPYPSTKHPDNQGAIVLGVGGDNSNNSFGTFYEGAIVKGYPAAATEQAIMDNVKAAGYGK